jgi:hypothetical protein
MDGKCAKKTKGKHKKQSKQKKTNKKNTHHPTNSKKKANKLKYISVREKNSYRMV